MRLVEEQGRTGDVAGRDAKVLNSHVPAGDALRDIEDVADGVFL